MKAEGEGHGTSWIESTLFDSAFGVAVVDVDGRYVMVNRSLSELIGAPSIDLVGQPADELIPDYEYRLLLDRPDIVDDPTWSFRGEVRVVANNVARWLDVNGSVTVTDAGRPGLLCIVSDITRLKASEQVHQRLLDQLRALLANTQELILLVDVQGRIVYSSPSSEESLRHIRQVRVGSSVLDLFHPDDVDHAAAQLAAARAQPGVAVDLTARAGDDAEGWRFVRGTATSRLEDTSVSGIVLSLLPEDDLRRAFGRVQQLEETQRVLVDESPLATLVIADGVVVFANSAAAAILGLHHGDDVLGMNPLDLVHPDHRDRAAEHLERAQDERGRERVQGELLIVRPDRGLAPLGVVYSPVHFHGIDALHVVLWDMTEQRRQLSRLPARGDIDPLTGLDRRNGLAVRIDRLLARVEPERRLAALLCDLDGFDDLNERHGHEAGDRVLQDIGRRLAEALRPGDVAVRYGGDEFLVVAEVDSPAGALLMCERLLDRVGQPVTVDGVEIVVSASAGLALGVAAAVDGDELLRRVDAALYDAKSRGPGSLSTSD